jgi:hypothetical protein
LRLGARIDTANHEATGRIVASRPAWIDVKPLREVCKSLGPRDVTHAGPPTTWDRMCPVLRGAVLAAVMAESWANTPEKATDLVRRGVVRLRSSHTLGGVGPITGVASPNLPVFVVEERAPGVRQGSLAWATPLEATDALGAHDAAALERRKVWREVYAPTLARAVRQAGGVDLSRVLTRALHRGDDLHLRTASATSLVLIEVTPHLIRANLQRDALLKTFEYAADEESFALPLVMGAARLAADAASEIEDSSVVTALTSNGVECGIQVSGLADQWFNAPAPTIRGRVSMGHAPQDAGRALGDASVLEVVGLGAFVLPTAPTSLDRLGITSAEAFKQSLDMQDICAGRHLLYTIPAHDFAGASVGIDIRRVVDSGIAPVLGAAIAHRDAGHGLLGIGLVEAPMACFVAALESFAEAKGVQ